MQPPGGDTDLRAQPKLAAIGKLGGGVVHHDGAVHFIEEPRGGGFVSGHNRFGMARGMLRDMRDGRVQPIHHGDTQHRIEIFGIPVIRGGGQDARIDRLRPRITAQFAARIDQRGHHIAAGGEGSIEQQCLHRPANPGPPHLGVHRDGAGHFRFCGGVNIGVADAVQMREHRHPRIALHPFDQAFAAARYDHVDQPGSRQHRADSGTILRGEQLHRGGGDAFRFNPGHKRRVQRAVGMHRLAPAAQQHRIARAQAQRSGIGGDVGTAFVDDPDQPDGNAAAQQFHPRRCGAAGNHLAHRIGQRGNLFDSSGDAFHPAFVQLQPIEQGGGQTARLASGHILRIGGHDRPGSSANRSGGSAQGGGFGSVTHPREHALRRPAFAGEALHQLIGVEGSLKLAGHARALSSHRSAVRPIRYLGARSTPRLVPAIR